MEDSRTDAAPSAPFPMPYSGRWADWEEPSERAYPLMVLTPAGETGPMGAPWAGVDWPLVVTGIAVLMITAEFGRRAGAPARMTALCSAVGFAVVVVVPRVVVPRVVPKVVSAVPRPRFRQPSTTAAR
ncbi:MAG: hypothetical protein ACRDNL_02380 [Spirillospora sp.]